MFSRSARQYGKAVDLTTGLAELTGAPVTLPKLQKQDGDMMRKWNMFKSAKLQED